MMARGWLRVPLLLILSAFRQSQADRSEGVLSWRDLEFDTKGLTIYSKIAAHNAEEALGMPRGWTEPEVASACVAPSNTQIPKTIHQIWFDMAGDKERAVQAGLDPASARAPPGPNHPAEAMPAHYWRYTQRWREMHPDYKYVLWDMHDSRAFLEQYYDWVLPVFDSFSPIKRADMMRYFIVFTYGGLYVDCDMEPMRSNTPLLDGHTFRIAIEDDREHKDRASPVFNIAWLASVPWHPFWPTVLHKVWTRRHTVGSPLQTTGPNMITNVLATPHTGFQAVIDRVCPWDYLFQEIYPYGYWDKKRADIVACVEAGSCVDVFPAAYTAHHWGLSWDGHHLAPGEKSPEVLLNPALHLPEKDNENGKEPPIEVKTGRKAKMEVVMSRAQLGILQVKKGDLDKARNTILAVLKDNKNHPEATVAFGVYRAKLGFANEAVQLLQDALEMASPRRRAEARMHIILAECLLACERPLEALEAVDAWRKLPFDLPITEVDQLLYTEASATEAAAAVDRAAQRMLAKWQMDPQGRENDVMARIVQDRNRALEVLNARGGEPLAHVSRKTVRQEPFALDGSVDLWRVHKQSDDSLLALTLKGNVNSIVKANAAIEKEGDLEFRARRPSLFDHISQARCSDFVRAVVGVLTTRMPDGRYPDLGPIVGMKLLKTSMTMHNLYNQAGEYDLAGEGLKKILPPATDLHYPMDEDGLSVRSLPDDVPVWTVLFLLSPRAKLWVDPDTLFARDAVGTAKWFMKGMHCFMLGDNMSKHGRWYMQRLVRYLERAVCHEHGENRAHPIMKEVAVTMLQSMFFGATYVDAEHDSAVKRMANQLFARLEDPRAATRVQEKQLPAPEPIGSETALHSSNVTEPSVPDERLNVVVISGAWKPDHVVYRNFAAAVRALALHYKVTLVYLKDQGDVDFEKHPTLLYGVHAYHKISIDSMEEFAENVKLIRDEIKPDVAFWPSVGMIKQAPLLANHRLAPIQITTYGHSVSTWGSQIDYFLGGAEIELTGEAPTQPGPDADPWVALRTATRTPHYSEMLVTMPGLGLQLERPNYHPSNPRRLQRPALTKAAAEASAASTAKDDEDVPLLDPSLEPFVFLCPWSLQKITHEHLQRLKQILQQVKAIAPEIRVEYQFVKIAQASGTTAHMMRRAEEVLGKGVVRLMPPRMKQDYYDLIHNTHAMLDSSPFGSCNTAMDALVTHTPMVMFEHLRWHSRIGTALFRRAGLSEFVTTHGDGFVEAAVRLVTEPDYWFATVRRLKRLEFDRLFFDSHEGEMTAAAVRVLVEKHQKLQALDDIPYAGPLSVTLRSAFAESPRDDGTEPEPPRNRVIGSGVREKRGWNSAPVDEGGMVLALGLLDLYSRCPLAQEQIEQQLQRQQKQSRQRGEQQGEVRFGNEDWKQQKEQHSLSSNSSSTASSSTSSPLLDPIALKEAAKDLMRQHRWAEAEDCLQLFVHAQYQYDIFPQSKPAPHPRFLHSLPPAPPDVLPRRPLGFAEGDWEYIEGVTEDPARMQRPRVSEEQIEDSLVCRQAGAHTALGRLYHTKAMAQQGHGVRGLRQSRDRLLSQAQHHYKLATTRCPQYHAAWYNLQLVAQMINRWEDAAVFGVRASVLRTDYAPYSRVLAQSVERVDHWTPNIKPFIKALTERPGTVEERDMDQALRKQRHETPHYSSKRGALRVFVYSLPARFNSELVSCVSDDSGKEKGSAWQIRERGEGQPIPLSLDALGQKLEKNTTHSLGDGGYYFQSQFSLEPLLHQRFLENAHRVANPAEADVFFVPYYPGLALMCYSVRRGDKQALQRLEDELFEELRQQLPGKWKSGEGTGRANARATLTGMSPQQAPGADHVMALGRTEYDFENTWEGAGTLLLREEIKHFTLLSIEGRLDAKGGDGLRGGPNEAKAGKPHANVIVVPYPTSVRSLVPRPRSVSSGPLSPVPRGCTQKEQQVAVQQWLGAPQEAHVPVYEVLHTLSPQRFYLMSLAASGKTTQRLKLMGQLEAHPYAEVVRLVDGEAVSGDRQQELLQVMSRSVFCLMPLGDTYTRRSFYDAILMGCVPVVFHRNPRWAFGNFLEAVETETTAGDSDSEGVGDDDGDVDDDGLPGAPFIRYSDVAVVLPPSAVDDVASALAEFTEKDIAHKQREVRKVAPLLQYRVYAERGSEEEKLACGGVERKTLGDGAAGQNSDMVNILRGRRALMAQLPEGGKEWARERLANLTQYDHLDAFDMILTELRARAAKHHHQLQL